ncbi:MAG: EthD domain-containing protein [Myxococcota bacterium]|jgi:uncharacterized protein (TIGR02118 family)|nr:EthD domain-containing protein [Myxococcota bacterium]
MIKLVYCVRRRADISEAEFFRYWKEEHGPLVKSVARDLRARRYLQSHTTAAEVNAGLSEGRGLGAPFDGITEVWWESVEELVAGSASPRGREAGRRLYEDEAHFIDFADSHLFLTEEHEIFDFTD